MPQPGTRQFVASPKRPGQQRLVSSSISAKTRQGGESAGREKPYLRRWSDRLTKEPEYSEQPKTLMVTEQGLGSGARKGSSSLPDYNVVASSRDFTRSKDLPSSPKLALVDGDIGMALPPQERRKEPYGPAGR
jgi:hypothetical protein